VEKWKKAQFDVSHLHDDLIRFSEATIRMELNQVEREIEKNETSLKDLQGNFDSIVEEINIASKENTEMEMIERNILDNIRLREQAQRMKLISSEEKGLAARLRSYNYDQVVKSLNNLNLERSDTVAMRSGKFF
jgi:hypothetical protein